ncbi:GIY-YIG nuclease family protein [Chromobacterium sp. LK1]|uniref:GIY-YIG nuclease family protein n=1 Tax=Chromobacterium sp. LK1 TaxID=1628193 RepID=UPI0009E23228|nr:GIY-YIG nuclease family protein [Chromobacterium sp. LK1]
MSTNKHAAHLPSASDQDAVLATLPPMANLIVDRAIENMTRKLVAGYRNKRNAKPNANQVDFGAEAKEALKASSAQSAMQVANRGQAWKEMIQKSLTHGISSLATISFDGQFTIRDGQRPDDFKDKMPNTPGVYVVFDHNDKPVYVGDSDNMQARWNAGHFNEYKQGQRPDAERYKLADEMEAGCTVKFIVMDSKETAAALEAHLIKENFAQFEGVRKTDKNLSPDEAAMRDQALDDGMLKNKKDELAKEQGSRSNQEAKKMKDASGTTATLVAGAAGEAFKNVGYDIFERLTTTAIKAIKDELVDVLRGGVDKIKVRVDRMLKKIFTVLRNVLENPLQLLRGIVEFIVNALSKTISQIYNLARNIFDLANNGWQLYKGAQTISREELVRKVSETVIVSGSLMIWDSLDLILEKWLVAQTGGALAPFSPYISAAVTAIGFGISTHALQGFVTRIIDAVIAFKCGYVEQLETERAACEQLIIVAENELTMIGDLGEYIGSELKVFAQMEAYTRTLSIHEPIQPIDPFSLHMDRS